MFEPFDQESDGAVEDRSSVVGGDRVPGQHLSPPELVVGLARDGHLNPVTVWCEGLGVSLECWPSLSREVAREFSASVRFRLDRN